MRFPYCKLFPSTLWAECGASQRSTELTPLYIERFHGPRKFHNFWRHDHWEMLYVLDGSGEIRSAPPHQNLAMRKGLIMAIPPGFPHMEVSKDTVELAWIGLGGTRVEALPADQLISVPDPDACDTFEMLWHLSRRGSGLIGPELDGLTQAVLGRLLCRWTEGASGAAAGIDRAIRLFNEQYATDLTMAEVAADLGWSEGHFYRAFKARTGRTPVEFLRDVRIRQAQHWLDSTDLPVARISRLVGFQDARYFTRVFKACTGQVPQAVRTAGREQSVVVYDTEHD